MEVRFHGVPAEERLHWRSFLVKLGTENLKGAKNEELLSVYIVYTILGDVCIYVVGKDEYDELALAEVIFAITSAVKDVCKSPLTERHFLDRYGKVRNYSMHVFWWLYALAEYENQISSHRRRDEIKIEMRWNRARVRDLLKEKSSLKSQPDWTTVLDGTQEGAYQWVTINYLLGKLGKMYANTVGVVDLGVVRSRWLMQSQKKMQPRPHKCLTGRILIYLHYGLLAARAEILKASEGGNNCILNGYQGTYKYGDDKFDASTAPSGTSYTKCRSDAVRGLKVDEPACTHMKCTFGGIWNGGGGDGQKNLFVASFFFDRAPKAGFVDPKKSVAKTKASDFEDTAKRASKLNIKDAKATYPSVSDDNIPYLCMDLVYQFTLLVDGFGVDPYQEITLIKQVRYGDAYVEAAWPLGSTIEVASSA
ncbi:apyrase 1 [Carex littledalei]|uniref:Apyrase 1 n=1 Tax=Carex littledalei TaxID=544730 RepID=A0A833QBG2_9POAL|nr:apyrase 1 [Carex littledalei]